MKMISKIAEMIRGELEDAEEYAKCAVKHKDDDIRLAEMFYNLARAELDHSSQEHDQVVRLIKEYDGDAPASMQAVWDWEHDHLITQTAHIKKLLEMYKE